MLEIEIATPASFDLLTVTGRMLLDGTLKVICFLDCRLNVGTKLIIAQSGVDLGGSFAAVSLQGFGAGAFSISYDTALRQVSLVVTEATSPVPESPSVVLLAVGLLLIGARTRQRQPIGNIVTSVTG